VEDEARLAGTPLLAAAAAGRPKKAHAGDLLANRLPDLPPQQLGALFPCGYRCTSAATIAAVEAAAVAAAKSGQPTPTPLRESLQDKVKKRLAQELEATETAQAEEDARTRQATEVSRWLDLTQWEKYFTGHSLRDARSLIDLPQRTDPNPLDPCLSYLLDSFDRPTAGSYVTKRREDQHLRSALCE
jgi:hypothetical protein